MKKYLSIFLIAILTLSLTACGEGSKTVEEPEKIETESNLEEDKDKIEKEKTSEEEVEEDKEEKKSSGLEGSITEKEATLYFVNDKYIETGNDDLDKFIPLKATIEVKDGAIGEAIIHALIAGPNGKEGVSTGIPENLKLLGLNLKDDVMYVDLSSEGLNGGSLEEELLLGQVVNSLLELNNVKGVKFLVDGEETDSLMGHFDGSETYTEKFE